MNRKYAWKPQKKDDRDLTFDRLVKLKKLTATTPPIVNNRYWCSEVEDQGQLGWCTACAWIGLLEYNKCKSGLGGKSYKDLSRLFLYYNERAIENTIYEDSGAELRDGGKALATYGICLEKEWPYLIDQFTVKPTYEVYKSAQPNHIHSYYSLKTLNDMRLCLANGRCFVFGFNVYDGFESDEVRDTGILQYPKSNEALLGGHAIMAVGYNDKQERFLIVKLVS